MTELQLPPYSYTITVQAGNATTDALAESFLAMGNKPVGFGAVLQPAYAPGLLTTWLDIALAPPRWRFFRAAGKRTATCSPIWH